MHHTLNKRDTYAKAIHEQKQLEEELSWGHTGTQEKLPTPPDERRWPPLSWHSEFTGITYVPGIDGKLENPDEEANAARRANGRLNKNKFNFRIK